MVRKVAIITVVMLGETSGVKLQGLLAILVLVMATVVHFRTMPFNSLLVDFSELFSLAASFATMFLGYMLQIRKGQADKTIITVLLILVNVGYLGLVVYLVYREQQELAAHIQLQEELDVKKEESIVAMMKEKNKLLKEQAEREAKEMMEAGMNESDACGFDISSSEEVQEKKSHTRRLRRDKRTVMGSGGVLIDPHGHAEHEMSNSNVPHLRLNQTHDVPYGVSLPTVILLNKKRIVIGRDPDMCDVVIRGGHKISRVHATVTCDDGKWYIEDNGSKYGTCVNGQGCGSDKIEIEIGAEVMIGPVMLTDEGNMSIEYIMGEATLRDIKSDDGCPDAPVTNILSL